jgi:hypothetical protein
MPDPPRAFSPATLPKARGVPSGIGRGRARRRPHRLRWALLGVGLLAVGLGAAAADAYVQAFHAGQRLRAVVPVLQGAREELLSSGRSARLDRARNEIRDIQASMDGARFTFGLTGALPFLGRPVDAVRLATSAATEVADGLAGGRDLVRDVIGGGEGRGLLRDGTIDMRLVAELEPRVRAVIGHLETARRDLLAIPSIPFVHQVATLKADALAQADQGLRAGRRALQGVSLLPSLLGADGPRTYFLALQNNADLRGTGGAVLGWGLLRVADGELHLLDGGSIGLIDDRQGTFVHVSRAIRWYLRVTGRPPRINNGMNFTPDFPEVAAAWALQIEKVKNVPVDGVIALDAEGAAALFRGQSAIRIPVSPEPLTAGTIAPFTEHGQYSLPEKAQRELPGQLVAAAFRALTHPRDLLAMSTGVSGALAEKRIQLWMEDPAAQAIVQEMGWDGALAPGAGDYLYLVDNKRIPNKVDYFGRTSLDYTIRVDPDGVGHASAAITLDSRVPKGEGSVVVGPFDPYGLNVAMLSLYVPGDASLTGYSPTAPVAFKTVPRGFRGHVEADLRVFTKAVAASPHHPATLRFDYDIPGVVQDTAGGKVYRLTIQHQPLVRAARLSVHLVLADGSDVTSAGDGWRVHGNEATFRRDLDRDVVTSLSYR